MLSVTWEDQVGEMVSVLESGHCQTSRLTGHRTHEDSEALHVDDEEQANQRERSSAGIPRRWTAS